MQRVIRILTGDTIIPLTPTDRKKENALRRDLWFFSG
jgi:hypothetical protein